MSGASMWIAVMIGLPQLSPLELAAWLPWWAGLFVWLSAAALTRKMLNGGKRLPRNRLSVPESASLSASLTNASERSADSISVGLIVGSTRKKRLTDTAAIILVAICSFGLGYFYRDHQELANTFTFHDVRVVKEADPHRWLLSTAYTGAWWITLCPGYTPRWEPGYLLTVLVYEDRGCKSLSGSKMGFVIARDGQGQPIKESY